jgi:hypothetical protein
MTDGHWTVKISTSDFFKRLYPDHDVITADGTFIVVPKGEMLPVYIGDSLAAISCQIAAHRGAPCIEPAIALDRA